MCRMAHVLRLPRKKNTLVIMTVTMTLFCFLAVELFQLRLSEVMDKEDKGKQDVEHLENVINNLTSRFTIDWHCKLEEGITAWRLAESWMTSRQITDPNQHNKLGCVLKAMQKEKISHADTGVKGTQLKLSITLNGGQRVVFKPKSYNRDYIMVGTPYAGKDRHNAEIAAFHLNRIIGLNRVPLVVGRKLDLESEIRVTAHKNLINTYYYRNDNTCFYGKCHYCKGPETGVCAEKTMIEGSLTLWLPDSYALSSVMPHPWRRTYRENKPAVWERDPNHCVTVKNTRPYEVPPRLLDLIDVAIFDFLISNADRHHYETFDYSKDSIVIALDNGKSFGNPYVDEESILAPLYQCCMLRKSTYVKLATLKDGVLGQVLFNVLRTEPLAPVLTPQNYIAVDRRLKTVFEKVAQCIDKTGGDDSTVLVEDGYT